MKKVIVISLIGFATIIFSRCQNRPIEIVDDFLILNINIVDVRNGAILPGRNVRLKEGIISGIYEDKVSINDSSKQIDGLGKYLIPGLWDMHTHYSLNYKYSSPMLVANGVTGIREMWGVMDSIRLIRNQTASGKLIAPDVYSSGSIIDGPPGYWDGSAVVRNRDEAIIEVKHQFQEGVDFLKVYGLLTKDAYTAISEQSQQLGVPFAGHVPLSMTIWETIQAHQHSIEHMEGILSASTSQPDELLQNFAGTRIFHPEAAKFLVKTFDPNLFDSLATVLAASNTWISPTLTVLYGSAYRHDLVSKADSRLDYMPNFIQRWWIPENKNLQASDSNEVINQKEFQLKLSLMGDLERSGVKILAGTDFPNPFCYPGFSIHDELRLMVEGGMSNAAALRTATYNPSLFMGNQTMGEIVQGKLASLVILNGNPLEDISYTSEIEAVFLHGKYLPRSTLDTLLQNAKEMAATMQPYF